MPKKLGVICFQNWKFFKDIYDNLKDNFEIQSYDGYKPRLKMISDHEHVKGFIENRLVNKRKIDEIMKWSDVTFFEWASEFLKIGTHLPKSTPIVARLHRFEIFKYDNQIDWDKLDMLVLVGKGMRRWVHERIDIDESRTTVIYNAINTDKFKPILQSREMTYRLGILGDIIPRKRVYELVLAFKELLEIMPDYNLVLSVAGKMEGEYPEFVKNLIKRLDIEGKVILEGRVDDIVKWYNSIDIIVSHSMHEGAHLAVHEGKACGCYPVSHWWDGVEEFLREGQIYFTNAEFCEIVNNFYNMSEAKRETLRKQGREEVVSTYGLPIIVNKFQKLFESLA
ncbi:MAG: glycosyltransferase family 4 protein [Thermoplasmata archaeon]|nr:MAG: glycosyltransferase family 4 protein [Thermoplasmata archaeon]